MKAVVLLKVLDTHNLLFKVLCMDERFRNTVDGRDLRFTASNGIEVISAEHPDFATEGLLDLRERKIAMVFLQGCQTSRDDAYVVAYVEDAALEKVRILEALREWATCWSGFGIGESSISDDDVLYNIGGHDGK